MAPFGAFPPPAGRLSLIERAAQESEVSGRRQRTQVAPSRRARRWVFDSQRSPSRPPVHYQQQGQASRPAISAWRITDTSETVSSCTMIVTVANAFTRAVHNRMPVLLDRPDLAAWLTGASGPELLRPAAENRLRLWPVSRRVNRTGGADDPALLAEIAA